MNVYIYFKHTKPDYDSDLFLSLVEKFNMGLNKEIFDKEDFYYKGDIFIYSVTDLWEIQKMFGETKLSLELDKSEFECIVV